MSSWTWFIAGIVLLFSELVLPMGFFLFLLGVAAALVGIATEFGLVAGWQTQAVAFAVLAVVFPFAFAARLKKAFFRKSTEASDDTIGKVVVVAEDIAAGGDGSGELWGSVWRLKNVGSTTLPAGAKAVVVAAHGVTLHVNVADK